jgi:ribosomal protein S18 acetylase RimI-like enzyme
MGREPVDRRPATRADRKFISDLIYDGIAPYEDRRLDESAQLDAVDRLIATVDTSIITVDGIDAGYVAVRRTRDEIYLSSIALLPACRRRGLGKRLLEELIAEAAAAGVPLRLAVREQNPAHRLYERLGFVLIRSEGTKLRMELDSS